MSVIDTARNISLLVKRGVTVELVEQLVKLRQEAEALLEENRKLKARVEEFEGGRAAEVRNDLNFDGTIYWGAKDGPGRDE
jgi:cell division protein FtsB